MRAITLWRPWDQAMLYGGKSVENRPWPLWNNMIGVPIAMHAGKKYDKDGALWMALHKLYTPPSDADSPTGIVGVVVFNRVVHPSPLIKMEDPVTDSDWFFGPYGWVVKEIHPLKEPIGCRGMQGLWTPDQGVQDRIVEQLPWLRAGNSKEG